MFPPLTQSLKSSSIRSLTTPSPFQYLEVLVALPVTSDNVMPLRLQTLRKVGCDETSSSSDTDPKLLGPVSFKSKLGEAADLLQVKQTHPGSAESLVELPYI